MSLAPSTTCWFVTTCPELSYTHPEPCACDVPLPALISTTPGWAAR